MKRTSPLIVSYILLLALVAAGVWVVSQKNNSAEQDSTQNIIIGEPALFQEVILEEHAGQYGTEFPTFEQRQTQYELDKLSHQGKIFSFDQQCIASPATMDIEVRDTALFDNVSDSPRDFRIDSPSSKYFTIPAHEYRILRFSSPGEYSIRCDGIKSAAILGVE